jgi:hypothetical protein
VNDETNPEWEQPLAEVVAAIAGCLAALDRYEATFADVLAPKAVPFAKPLAGSDPEWGHKLEAAKEVADGLDQELAGHEAEWNRWRVSFSAWRTGIEKG